MRLILVPVLLIAACGPAPSEAPDPGSPTVIDATPGWNEVEPNTCDLDDFAQYVGQTAAEVEGAGITRIYRVIPEGGIVTQEYAAGRVNFWLNRSGDVERIGCG